MIDPSAGASPQPDRSDDPAGQPVELHLSLTAEAGSLEHQVHAIQGLSQSYQEALKNFKAFLYSLKQELEQIKVPQNYDTKWPDPKREHLEELQRLRSDPIATKFTEAWEALEAVAAQVPNEGGLRRKYAEATQSYLGHYLLQSSFAEWCIKDRGGHPGDVGIIGMLLRERLPLPEHQTDYTMMGLFLDDRFLRSDVATAHRHRIIEIIPTWLEKEIVNTSHRSSEEIRILSFGVGNGREYRELLKPDESGKNVIQELGHRIKIFLRDPKPRAVLSAHNAIFESIELINSPLVDVNHQAKGAMRFLTEGRKNKEIRQLVEPCDIIYFAGMGDYLNDQTLAGVVRTMYAHLKPGGVMVFTNVHSRNPDKNIQEMFMNWGLIYRDEEQMAQFGEMLDLERQAIDRDDFLADPSILKPGSHGSFLDPTGLNIFQCIRKPL